MALNQELSAEVARPGQWPARSTPLLDELRSLNLTELRRRLTSAEALHIVQDDQVRRAAERADEASEKTKAGYRRMFDRHFIEPAEQSPEEFRFTDQVAAFIAQADCAASTWTNKRSAYVFALRKIVDRQTAEPFGQQFDTIEALALLLIVRSQPSKNRTEELVKGMAQADLEAIVQRLEELRSKSPSHRQIQVWPSRAIAALRATIATGLRPAEWRDTRLRSATERDLPQATGDARAMNALDVCNAKRKHYQPLESRTLLFRKGNEIPWIREHLYTVQRYLEVATSAGTDASDASEIYHDRCSRLIREACQKEWPNEPLRWITLKTLRFQVAANCKRRFGNAISAAMMGHAPGVGRTAYPSAAKGWEISDKSFTEFVVQPSASLLRRAASWKKSGSIKQRERSEVSDREGANAVSAPSHDTEAAVSEDSPGLETYSYEP